MKRKALKIQFKREYFIKLVLEVFSVIFAVLLALLVNEWRQNKANERLAHNAYNNVLQEITENKQKVDSALINHKAIITNLDSTIKGLKKSADEDDLGVNIGTIEMEVLSNTAWATINSTNVINYMDFTSIMEISNLYSVQDMYTNSVDKFLNDPALSDLYTIEDYSDDQTKIKQRIFKVLISIKTHLIKIVSLGEQLSEAYKENLKELNTKKLN